MSGSPGDDGKHSFVARSVQASLYDAHPARTCSYYSYWSGVPAEGMEVYVRDQCDIIVLPMNEGLMTVAKEPKLSYTIISSFDRGESSMAKQAQKLFRVGAAAHELGLHPMTVRRWIKAGRIQVVQVGREMRIPRSEIERMLGASDERLLVLYGRVSGHGQKDDLQTQLERLQTWAKTERRGMEILVLPDIGSGLKAGRRHLQRLLKLVCEDKVSEIAITYEDRLTRFGQEFLATLFSCFGVRLTVLEPGEEKTTAQELTDDLLALLASFSGRLYGMRSHKQKELLQCAQAVLTSP